jgi:hypothetical protein
MNWVEKKVRRHLMRARNRAGFGWARWSTVGLYDVGNVSKRARRRRARRTDR